MVSKPSTLPMWAQNDVVDPTTGQNNVVTPPIEKQNVGWSFEEYPPRGWFNWLARFTYRWLAWLSQQEAQSVVADGTGATPLFPTIGPNLIVLWAVDTTNRANYLYAMGFVAGSGVPQLNIVSSNGLTIGSLGVNGSVAITPAGGGGTQAQIYCWGQTKIIPS